LVGICGHVHSWKNPLPSLNIGAGEQLRQDSKNFGVSYLEIRKHHPGSQ
jgi:hypothetical protein